MKKKEIKEGSHYRAKVSNKLTTVRVDKIRETQGISGLRKSATVYDVTNIATGRKTTFRSATKFQREVDYKPARTKKSPEGVKPSSLTERLQPQPDVVDDAPHLIIEARAGTGKTTTLVEGLRVVLGEDPDRLRIEPSPQQSAIWYAMAPDRARGENPPRTICFVAFNKSIAMELQQRVPDGCWAMTMHSMGFKAVTRAFGRVQVSQDRVQEIIAELLGRDIKELRWKEPILVKATQKLVSLCKMNLTGLYDNGSMDAPNSCYWSRNLVELAAHYDVDLNDQQARVFDLVPKVLERCKDVGRDGCVDFDDMIWLPIVLDLPVFKYDLLLVDEAQDLNRCQQALAIKAGKRLILCGDSKQAIYGFAGADSESMTRMEKHLSGEVGPINGPRCPECGNSLQNAIPSGSPLYRRCASCKHVWEFGQGCITLPLTVTRRCGRAIVEEARKIVPDFEAHESCCDGRVTCMELNEKGQNTPRQVLEGDHKPSYRNQVCNGDMVLCRVNAPLVSECFKFLKAGRKATIQGRDVGQGLISTIKRLMEKKGEGSGEVCSLLGRLSFWLAMEQRKENAKRYPSEARLIALQDRHDCIVCFTEDCETVDQVVKRIEDVFTDEKNGTGVRLATVHKAKGLESDRVFLLQPEGATIPHPMAKTAWQVEQEYNLLYVAITRAIKELIYVS